MRTSGRGNDAPMVLAPVVVALLAVVILGPTKTMDAVHDLVSEIVMLARTFINALL